MTLLEATAAIFSLACVALTMRRHIAAWPVGIVGIGAYFVLFWRDKLYADMSLQVVYFLQSIYGWYHWRAQKQEHEEIPIRQLQPLQWLGLLLGVVVLWLGWSWALLTYTDARLPYWDCLASSLSLVANTLLALRWIDNWLLWIVADVLLVGIFAWRGFYLSMATYAIFLVMAVMGWRQWRQAMQAQ